MEKEILETKKPTGKNRNKIIAVISAVAIFFSGYAIAYFTLKNNYGSVPDQTIKNLNRIEKLISENYYTDFEKDKLYRYAEEFMVYGLSDPYSYYLDETSAKEFDEDVSGNYVGIGVTLTPDENGMIKILAPFDGSPAQEAGIMAEDILYKVNGVEYKYENVDEAVSVIKGKPGDKVQLEIIRGVKTLSFEVEKRKIEVASVTSKKVSDNIILLRISRFDLTTAADFVAELDKYELTKETGLILDLRDNPGGVVTAALDIADMFISEGRILTEKFKNHDDIVTDADSFKLDIKYPIAVLVNSNSASASEILTGALKDTKVAKLFGEKTYGKGVLNQKFAIDSKSSLVLSVGEYTTPSGVSIHKIGIKPDFEISLPDELYYKPIADLTYEEDLQLQKAADYLTKGDAE